MLSLDDPRWTQLRGGRRTPCDPRPLFAKLEAGKDTQAVWHTLWDELHHQGDVDEVSYASVPHLVRIYRQRVILDWNTYAMVGTIELARGESVDPLHGKRKNPEIPDWLKEGYFEAIGELAEIGMKELLGVQDRDELRGILCIIAVQKGARTYARMLLEYSEEELLDVESEAAETRSGRSKANLQRALGTLRKK